MGEADAMPIAHAREVIFDEEQSVNISGNTGKQPKLDRLWQCLGAAGCAIFILYSIPLVLVPITAFIKASRCFGADESSWEALRCSRMRAFMMTFSIVSGSMLLVLLAVKLRW